MMPLLTRVTGAALALAVTWILGAAGPVHAAPASLLGGLELFQIDPAHSPIEFSVAFMGLSKVRGAFADFAGAIALDRADLTRSSVTVVIRTRSLTTFNAQRDRDLKGADWFDVEKYPLAVFSSREIVTQGQGYLMRGSLTLHGVTREVEIPIMLNGRIKGPGGDDIVGFEGHAALNRKDYGVIGPANYNALLELGKAMVADEVDLPLSVEAFRPGRQDTLRDHAADSLCRAVEARGPAPVAKEYRSLRAATADSLMAVREPQLNAAGMQLVERGRSLDGLELFKLEAEFYPQSASGPSGLAYAYATLGDRANAIASADRAVALNPAAARAIEILRRVKVGT
jgi:polyisoprenoid-binding protein YceI